MIICWCGKEFELKRKNQRHCRPDCRKKYHSRTTALVRIRRDRLQQVRAAIKRLERSVARRAGCVGEPWVRVIALWLQKRQQKG